MPFLFKIIAVLIGIFIWKAIILGAVIFIAQKKLKWHPVIFIALSAVIGILLKF